MLKQCTKCSEIRDVLLFPIKDKKRRKSYCKFCVTSFPKSKYVYKTKEQQQIAQKNLILLTRDLRRIKLGRNLCSCKNEKLLGKKKCNECLLKIKKEVSRKKSKKNDKNKVRAKRKLARKIQQLKKSYVFHMIQTSIKNTTGIKIKEIPDDLIELKRKQLLLKRKIKNNG
jgi:hypothetical protein